MTMNDTHYGYRDSADLTPGERRERLVELLAEASARLAQKQLGFALDESSGKKVDLNAPTQEEGT